MGITKVLQTCLSFLLLLLLSAPFPALIPLGLQGKGGGGEEGGGGARR